MPRGSRIPARELAWLRSITAAGCADCGAPLRIVRLPDGTTTPDAAFRFRDRTLYCPTGPCAEARAARR